jgi:2',3'-cyclic-nucleotide 2'-phosphodiesterase (5'-nucleotidase family)
MLTTVSKHFFVYFLILFLLAACKTNLAVSVAKVGNVHIGQSAIGEDSVLKQLILPYKKQIDESMNKVIGRAAKELRCERTDVESPLGNFIVDLLHEETAKLYHLPIDFCIVNNGGLRVPIREGNITVGNIFELMPFENEVIVISITGKELQDLFAYEAHYRKTSFSRVELRFTPEGQLLSEKIGGEKVIADKTYKVVTYDYLANGGDAMNCLKNLPREPMGVTVRTLILQHIEQLHKQQKMADGNIENRVVFK